ncbi:Protein with DEXDc plus ring plus HELICc [Phytophthora palmivora]|uniref:Protein with DEXDc plus ring plus HELICc n=1 Tax=Phytophthora palmivora TaxID=4796 RepID=A0A2P4YF70_9STRA|nr:Protein with DEXDc plus ring plus HELICc [Phytophthora palmivora]
MALVYAAIIVASSPPNTQSDLGSVAVDLPLSVPGQVHIGTYKHASNGLYVRDLPWVNVYFSLQALASNDATESVMKWHFRGYECSPNNEEEKRECSEFTSAKLESTDNTHTYHCDSRYSGTDNSNTYYSDPSDTTPDNSSTNNSPAYNGNTGYTGADNSTTNNSHTYHGNTGYTGADNSTTNNSHTYHGDTRVVHTTLSNKPTFTDNSIPTMSATATQAQGPATTTPDTVTPGTSNQR